MRLFWFGVQVQGAAYGLGYPKARSHVRVLILVQPQLGSQTSLEPKPQTQTLANPPLTSQARSTMRGKPPNPYAPAASKNHEALFLIEHIYICTHIHIYNTNIYTYACVYPCNYLSTYLSTYLSIDLSNRLSIYLFI